MRVVSAEQSTVLLRNADFNQLRLILRFRPGGLGLARVRIPPGTGKPLDAGHGADPARRGPGGWRKRGESGVLTCSALKRSYRDIIIGNRSDVTLVYLKGSHDLIHRRMAARHEHFMPVALLDSQFATLEEPTPDEHPITVDVGAKPIEIVTEIVHQMEERQAGGQSNKLLSRGRAS